MSDTSRKVLFFVLAFIVLGLKVYGMIAGKIAWPLIIVLGFIGVITEPTPLMAAECERTNTCG